MANEIIVKVKVVEDEGNKAIRARLEAEARDIGENIAINVNKKVTERLQKEATKSASGGGDYARTGDVIGETIGKHISEKINERIKVDVNGRLRDERGRFVSGGGNGREHVTVTDRNRETVHVDVDVDQKSLMERISAFGKDAGEKFSSFFQDGFKSVAGGIFNGDVISLLFKGLSVAAITAVAAPVLGAGLSAAVMTALGGGVIAAGLIGAFKDPRIKTAWEGNVVAITGSKWNPKEIRKGGLKQQLEEEFKSFSDNFRGPLENFLASPRSSKTGGLTGLQGVLAQIKPQVDQLGESFGRLTDKLLNQGLTGLLQNMLPAILRAMQGALPFIDTLADKMPGIGAAIGQLFDAINNNSAGAQLFWSDFLDALIKIIPLIGAIIGGLSNMYLSVRLFFAKMRLAAWEFASGFLNAADAAFGWIPGLGPKFASAKKKVQGFVNDANKDLKKIHDVQVTVTLKTAFGRAWAAIHEITGALQAIGAVKQIGNKGPSAGFGGKATGGITGTAATGGARNGLTWVGEQGAELADMAPGSRVYSHADSMRMAGSSGGGGPTIINLMVDGKVIARAMADPMRDFVRNSFGGSVQNAYGS